MGLLLARNHPFISFDRFSEWTCFLVRITDVISDCVLHRNAPEAPMSDFTLYFLGYDHGDNLSPEENNVNREGNNSDLLDSIQYPHFPQASLNWFTIMAPNRILLLLATLLATVNPAVDSDILASLSRTSKRPVNDLRSWGSHFRRGLLMAR
jgi:hypothetical protein